MWVVCVCPEEGQWEGPRGEVGTGEPYPEWVLDTHQLLWSLRHAGQVQLLFYKKQSEAQEGEVPWSGSHDCQWAGPASFDRRAMQSRFYMLLCIGDIVSG